MSDFSLWNKEPNKRSLAIIRRSSYGQEHNTSAETQEREINDYCKRHKLELLKVEPIIETAYKSEERKKYKNILEFALQNGIRHILFYISSREARNLTDNERNEKLIKSDKIVIHHVKENKVFHKDSPDSDFLLRDINASINKHYSRENSTKVKASFVTKAENGWWPYRHTPLGYVHQKEKDKFGNAIKGTAKLVPDPDPVIIKLVQREFELRAAGRSYDDIKQQVTEECLVPENMVKKYTRRGIATRLANSLYRGYFYLKDNPKRYEGRHELIIPGNIIKSVDRINNGRSRSRKPLDEQGVFSDGWLTCGHPDCGRQIIYDPKVKLIKSTGETKTYNYYRCTNSRNVHEKKVYISEDKILEQFEEGVGSFDITKEFAADIKKVLEITHEKQKKAIRKQMEGFREAIKEAESKEDTAYNLLEQGSIDSKVYKRRINTIREEKRRKTIHTN